MPYIYTPAPMKVKIGVTQERVTQLKWTLQTTWQTAAAIKQIDDNFTYDEALPR